MSNQHNTIQEYLASLGFKVDKNSFKTFGDYLKSADKQVGGLDKSFGGMGKTLTSLGLGFTAFAGGLAAFTAGVSGMGRGLGNITMGVDKFALSLYTTQRNARNLQSVMSAMGIDSLDDLKYINLIPEQRQQFMQLRSLASELAPDDDTKKGLAELRKLGFEFQKFQIEMSYIGLKLLGDFGNLMRTPLFKTLPKLIQVGIDLLAFVATEIGKNPLSAGIGGVAGYGLGGVAGSTAGSTIGGWVGGGLGSFIGPEGTVIGAGIGRAAGGAIGGALGSAGGAAAGVTTGAVAPKAFKGFNLGGVSWKGAKPHKDPHGYKAYAIQQALKYGVDPAILMALINQESGWNPKARSGVGAIGIGQFMPATAKSMGINPHDPFQSIEGSARYLKNAMIHYKGNTSSALASYNAGFGAVDRYHGVPPYRETINYVKAITAKAAQIRKEQGAFIEEAKSKSGKQPVTISVNIEVNGAKSPSESANVIAAHLDNFLNTRNLQGFA